MDHLTRNIVVQTTQLKQEFENGLIVEAFNLSTFEKIKVYKEGSKIMKLIETSKDKEYTGVNLYINRPTDLNLTQEETQEGIKKCYETQQIAILTVYRSSGAKDANGKPLTREQQIKEGLARPIRVRFFRKDTNASFTLNAGDYLADIAKERNGEEIKD